MLEFFDDNLVNLLNGVALAAALFIIAVGLSVVFGIMDVLNLAHGAVYLAGAYVGVAVIGSGSPSVGVFVLAVLLAAALGAVLGGGLALAATPVRRHLDQALLTLGVALITEEVLSVIFGNDVRAVSAPTPLNESVSLAGQQYPVYRLVLVGVGAVLAIGLYLAVERTSLGAVVRATVADRGMVEAVGINTTVVFVGVFALGSALAALGGVLAGPMLGAQPGLDTQVLLLALVVVVVGGLGSIRGALLGALLVGEVQALGVALVPEFASFLLFGAMALVLLARPKGLLPDPSAAAHA